ncbi:MAG: methyltransferase [Algoriphagus sp.]|nr:methyltransferase [Algoriphagus sp.]
MANSWFQFQEFLIEQDRCAMKISTDAVLLGALANAENPSKILDIGTGTGVIALMLAQRFPHSRIQAVEIDPAAASQARENFEKSPFAERMEMWEGKFQEFSSSEKFDLIVSNPPYFPDHLKSNDAQRNLALHNDGLPFGDLVKKVSTILAPGAKFWVILPPRQMLDLEKIARLHDLFPSQKFTIQDNPAKPVIREVVAFEFEEKEIFQNEILIKDDSGGFHDSYRKLISGFLLNF